MEIKIAAKTLKLDERAKADWRFETRPGGIIVATNLNSGLQHRLYAVEKGAQISFQIDGVHRSGEWIASRRGGAGKQTSDADLIAQFPGKVRKILVKIGEAVEAGQALLQVEAMKMEFPILAPFNGKVKALPFKEGEQISPGQKLIELDPV